VNDSNAAIRPTKTYSEFLEDTEITFLHTQKDHVSLSDIFVYPDLQYLQDDPDSHEISRSSKQVIENIPDKLLILGQEQSGKTSLAKRIIANYSDENELVLYVEAKAIARTDLSRQLTSIVKQQYGIDSYEEFLATPYKKSIVIDDYTDIKLNKRHQPTFLGKIESDFERIVVLADDSLKHSDYEYVLFRDFEQFELKPFGHLLRSQLIRKWCSLGQEETIDDALLLGQIDSSKLHIDSMLRKNIVPAKPLFIVTILQSLQTFRPTDYGLTSYGHCYQHLILQNLTKAEIGATEIDAYINYMTEIAYFIYKTQKSSITDEEFSNFKQEYSDSYIMNDSHESVVEKLTSAGILRTTGDQLSFSYKYVFYFYTAKYIADNINSSDTKATIEALCEKIHSEKHANILIFITHHSKDRSVIDEIRLYTSAIFDKFSEADLGANDLLHLKEELEEIPALAYEEKSVEEEREARLKRQDEWEANEPQDEGDEGDDSEISEEEEINKLLSDVVRSAKSVEIIGQILRNRYGSMRRDELLDLAIEAYSAGLRYLKFYLSLTDDHKDEVIENIATILSDRNIKDKARAVKLAKRLLLGFCYGMSLSVIRKIAYSVGTEKLLTIFDEISARDKTPAKNLINLCIHLEFKKVIPKKMIEDMKASFEGNILCTRMLQEVVLQHQYMHYLEYGDKQWIASTLNIPIETQRSLEMNKKTKILPKQKKG
jgi:hypothetical protein